MKKKDQRRPHLRPGYEFMEPDELPPEERWELVLDLLTEMCLAADRKDADQSASS